MVGWLVPLRAHRSSWVVVVTCVFCVPFDGLLIPYSWVMVPLQDSTRVHLLVLFASGLRPAVCIPKPSGMPPACAGAFPDNTEFKHTCLSEWPVLPDGSYECFVRIDLCGSPGADGLSSAMSVICGRNPE